MTDPLTTSTQAQWFTANRTTYSEVLTRLGVLASGSGAEKSFVETDNLSTWARQLSDLFGLQGPDSPTYVPPATETTTATPTPEPAPKSNKGLVFVGMAILLWFLWRK